MNRRSLASWLIVIAGAIYFLAPLIATFEFSLRLKRGVYSFEAYRIIFASSDFQAALLFSAILGFVTIVVGVLIVTPTAYWVQMRLPQLRGTVEFITLLPLVIPAREARTFLERVPQALAKVLLQLGVAPTVIDGEVRAMAEPRIGRTANRQVLGSVNEFLRIMRGEWQPSLTALSLSLAEAPCGPIGGASPDDLTRKILSGSPYLS